MAKRTRAALMIGLAAIGLILIAGANRRDWMLYNESPSAPVGFYVRVDAAPAEGSFATVRSIEVAPHYAEQRGFVDTGDRFIKRIAAGAGDEVCGRGASVTVNAKAFERLSHDRSGRALPTWVGCRVLRAGEFFLLGDTPDSFDSRYFGVVRADQVEGVWRPL